MTDARRKSARRSLLGAWLFVGLLVLVGPAAVVLAATSDSTSTGSLSVESGELESPASLAGRVWDDLDHDGLLDAAEPGVNGVMVELFDDNDDQVGSPQVTAHDGSHDGAFRFEDLSTGTYQLAFSGLPPGFDFTVAGGDSVADPSTGRSTDIVLAAGQARVDGHAGVWRPQPSIALEKRAQGVDADSPPGPSVPVGGTVSFDYLATNDGNESLDGLDVTDDQGLTVTCPQTTVAVDQTVTCTATAAAAPGTNANVGTATATGQFSGTAVSAEDAAHYTGVTPGLDVEKSVNGIDADTGATAIEILAGADVSFAFTVANAGTEDIEDIVLNDSVYGPIQCPESTLAPTETMTCDTVDDIAAVGLHTNVAEVNGVGAVSGDAPGDSDAANYRGLAPSMSLLKEVRDPATGQFVDGDADGGSPGTNDGSVPSYQPATTVDYRFQVANTGDTAITTVGLGDDHCDAAPVLVAGDAAPSGVLDIGETWTYRCAVTGVTSGFTNTATVAGDTTVGPPAGNGASERATVAVAGPAAVTLTKEVRRPSGTWADSATIDEGDDVTFRLRVENTGQAPLVNLVVTDPQAPGCDRSFPGPLLPGDAIGFYTCAVTGVDQAFTNVATVTADPTTSAAPVTDQDQAAVDVRTVLDQNLALDKTLVATSPGSATFRLTVHNQGPGTAPAPISVIDDLPTGLSFDSASGVGWACSDVAQQITCTRGQSIADGSSASVLLTVTVAPNTGQVVNVARLVTIDDDPADNVDDAVFGGSSGPGDPGAPPGGPAERGADGREPEGSLPQTGTDVLGLVLMGSGLLGIGLVLVVVARRRRSRPGPMGG